MGDFDWALNFGGKFGLKELNELSRNLDFCHMGKEQWET